jgi:hypothetical protein
LCVAAGARNEHAAARHKNLIPAQRGAKRGQGRNGINGKAPRSGRGPVYAGFNLDPAPRSASARSPAYRARTTKSLRQALHRFLARKALSYLFKNVSRPKREGLADLQFKLLSVGSQGDPNMMIYTNEGGRERAVPSVRRAINPSSSPYTRRSQNQGLCQRQRGIFELRAGSIADPALGPWHARWPSATGRSLSAGRRPPPAAVCPACSRRPRRSF